MTMSARLPRALLLGSVLLGSLPIGGCLSAGGSEVSASSSRRTSDDDGKERSAPRQMCEHTAIGGQPKSFCY